MQSKFNMEALNEQFNAVNDDQSFKAVVRQIDQMKADEIFGADCENPDRDVILLKIEVNDGEFFNETYSLPKSAGSWKRENFKLGQFARKYGSVPFVGQEVQVKVNTEGYYRVAV